MNAHRHHPPHFPAPLAPFGGLPPPAPDWFTEALADVPVRTELKVQGTPIEALAWGRVGDPGLLLLHGNSAHADWYSFIGPLLAGALIAFAALAPLPARAQASPTGLWKTIDDETKAEKSQVRISDTGGVLTGKIEKIADATKQDSTCVECTDERKGQKVLGMTIIRGAKPDAGKTTWEGGEILDPNNGKVYKLLLKPIDGGKKLEVRGSIGPFGRTQTWIRIQ